MISVQRIETLRSQDARIVDLEVVSETGSTNADLLARVTELVRPVLRVAERQTQGRGRAGRAWLSTPGGSLTFSLAWKFGGGVQTLTGLPLAVGVAVSQALDAFGVRTGLKWPNDILKDGKKLGGILIETENVPEGSWAVIGVGLNLMLPDEMEAQIGQPVAEARWLAQADRSVLMASLLNALASAMVVFERDGLRAFTDRWNQLHFHAGKKIVMLRDDQVYLEGVAHGVDEWGRLLVDTPVGRQAVHSGEVSLRATEE
ncbi:MAG: biotin--[acetyl-CoA-carboxylase] ligase [Oxalobacter sp.]|nr:MAG: biotin--[acetyl-CoA-carboxylase] ligase [Oxalobacter sp.]